MGILDFLTKQFIDVIDWTEEEDGVLSWRFPVADREIQNGAQLTVRDTQLALFVNEGVVADLFKPGLHSLTTRTLPIMTSLQNWDKAFASPFKSDIYFFSTREQIDQRWGTPNPITIPDALLGPIRLRAHGAYSFRLDDPKVFFNKISGTREKYTREELEGQLRSLIITSIASFLGGAKVDFINMAANQLQFSETLKKALEPSFTVYGLTLASFFVQSLSLPEELQSHLDKVASMKMLGDLRQYAQFQSAEGILAAAQNSSGAAGGGIGLMAGMGLGQNMVGAVGTNSAQAPEDPIKTLDRLHELMKKGIISQPEFDAKKAELLKKIN